MTCFWLVGVILLSGCAPSHRVWHELRKPGPVVQPQRLDNAGRPCDLDGGPLGPVELRRGLAEACRP